MAHVEGLPDVRERQRGDDQRVEEAILSWDVPKQPATLANQVSGFENRSPVTISSPPQEIAELDASGWIAHAKTTNVHAKKSENYQRQAAGPPAEPAGDAHRGKAEAGNGGGHQHQRAESDGQGVTRGSEPVRKITVPHPVVADEPAQARHGDADHHPGQPNGKDQGNSFTAGVQAQKDEQQEHLTYSERHAEDPTRGASNSSTTGKRQTMASWATGGQRKVEPAANSGAGRPLPGRMYCAHSRELSFKRERPTQEIDLQYGQSSHPEGSDVCDPWGCDAFHGAFPTQSAQGL